MPRKQRMYLPGIPCHIIQRGNNRETTFFNDSDYQFYLECLDHAVNKYKADIHAYVLMTNHVHILMTPLHKESISLVMQSIGRRYVQYINKKHKRTGTLWESRHKASLVDSEAYLLACSRYIEMNPVNANRVKHPSEYKWSSYKHNACGELNKLICPHEIYIRLGPNDELRQQAYTSLFNVDVDIKETQFIRNAVCFSMPTGGKKFQHQIEKIVSRKLGYAKKGRPQGT